jgi:aspartate aminotransferase
MGAFYVVARLPIHDAEYFCSYLLTDFSHQGSTVFLAPAQGFFLDAQRGVNKVRVAFVLGEDKLVEAVRVLAEGLYRYRKDIGR